MAVRVDCDVEWRFGGMAVFEPKGRRIGFERPLNKPFKKERALSDPLGVRDSEFAVVFREHGVTGRLQKNDWRAARRTAQQFHIMPPELGRGIQVALAKGGTSATAPAHRKDDFHFECL